MTIAKVKKHYDSEGDILYVEFEPVRLAKGIQLTENIVLRVDPVSGEVWGLAIHNYTKIVAQDIADPLTGLPPSDTALYKALFQAFNAKPLNDFLLLHRSAISLGPALLPQAATVP